MSRKKIRRTRTGFGMRVSEKHTENAELRIGLRKYLRERKEKSNEKGTKTD